jgi:hypothetical protein
MYVQCKNYFLGKTTHERFSKRAAASNASLLGLQDGDEIVEEIVTP